jgi:hypothetical protein
MTTPYLHARARASGFTALAALIALTVVLPSTPVS